MVIGSDALGAREEGVVVGLQQTGEIEPSTEKEELAGSVCKGGVGGGWSGKERMGVVGTGEVIIGIGEEGCGEKGKDADCRGSGQ